MTISEYKVEVRIGFRLGQGLFRIWDSWSLSSQRQKYEEVCVFVLNLNTLRYLFSLRKHLHWQNPAE